MQVERLPVLARRSARVSDNNTTARSLTAYSTGPWFAVTQRLEIRYMLAYEYCDAKRFATLEQKAEMFVFTSSRMLRTVCQRGLRRQLPIRRAYCGIALSSSKFAYFGEDMSE
jgi:hypothetical protein